MSDDNGINFLCSHCSQSLEAESDMAGQVIKCPTCYKSITIPAPPPSIPQLSLRNFLSKPGETSIVESGKCVNKVTSISLTHVPHFAEAAEKVASGLLTQAGPKIRHHSCSSEPITRHTIASNADTHGLEKCDSAFDAESHMKHEPDWHRTNKTSPDTTSMSTDLNTTLSMGSILRLSLGELLPSVIVYLMKFFGFFVLALGVIGLGFWQQLFFFHAHVIFRVIATIVYAVFALCFFIKILGWMAQQYLAVAEQYERGALIPNMDRPKLVCLGMYLEVHAIGSLPLICGIFTLWLAGLGPIQLCLLGCGALWFGFYVPMGIAVAGAYGVINPIFVLRTTVKMFTGYFFLLLYCVPFIVASYIAANLLQVAVSGASELKLAQFLASMLTEVVGMLFIQFGAFSLVAMIGALLRKYKNSQQITRSEVTESLRYTGVAIAVAIGLAALRLAPFWTADPITQSQHINLVNKLIAEMADSGKLSSSERNVAMLKATSEVAKILKSRPHFFGDYCHELEKTEPAIAAAREEILRIIMVNIFSKSSSVTSANTVDVPDPAALLEIPSVRTSIYNAAFAIITNERDVNWLLEQSCSEIPNVRLFAADALRSTFLFQILDKDMQSQLASKMSLDEKKSIYKQFLSKSEQRWEQALAGQYAFAFEGIWREGDKTEKVKFQADRHCLKVACSNGQWKINFLDVIWNGDTRQLPSLNLSSPRRESVEKLGFNEMWAARFSDYARWKDKSIFLISSCQQGTFQVILNCYPEFIAPQRIETVDTTDRVTRSYSHRGIRSSPLRVTSSFDHGRPGFTEFRCYLVKTPPVKETFIASEAKPEPVRKIEQPKLETPELTRKIEQPKPEAVLRDMGEIRAELLTEYDQKLPERVVGDFVKLYHHGISISGKVTEITSASVVLFSEQNTRVVIPLIDLDTDSRCLLDHVFRAREIERVAQQRAAALSEPLHGTPLMAAPAISPAQLSQTPASPNPPSPAILPPSEKSKDALKIEEYQKKIEELNTVLKTVTKQCTNAKVNYDRASLQYNQTKNTLKTQNSVKNENAKWQDMNDKKKSYDALNSQKENISSDIQNYNQIISNLQQKKYN